MNRNKVLLMGALASASMALGTIAVLTSNNPSVGLAGGCEHTHVEHYSQAADPNSKIIVEHWACCECHQAWADEARTVLLSENTTADRSKLDIDLGMSFATQWTTARTKLIYDETRGYTFRTMAKELAQDAYNCIETVGTPWTLEATKSLGYFGAVTNRTTAVIRVDVHRRAWGSRSDSFYLGVGETKNFSVTVDDFNAETSGGNYGFALLCYNTAEQTAEGYIDVTSPVYESVTPSLFRSIQNYTTWSRYAPRFSKNYGIEFFNDEVIADESSTNRLIDARKLIDAARYMGVSFKVYNDSDVETGGGNIWSGSKYCPHPSFLPHQWTEVKIPASIWNGDGAETANIDICDLGSRDIKLKFADFKLIERGEPIVAFGEQDSEFITTQLADTTFINTVKENTDKGPGFKIGWHNEYLCFATNGKKPVDADAYDEVEFYIYNGTEGDLTFHSTSDWNVYTTYDSFAAGTWTKCVMPVAEYNKTTTYFYPIGGDAGAGGYILMTYWTAK